LRRSSRVAKAPSDETEEEGGEEEEECADEDEDEEDDDDEGRTRKNARKEVRAIEVLAEVGDHVRAEE
jgi:hypothetical protein